MRVSLYVTSCFFCAFQILSLSLNFDILIIRSLGVDLCASHLNSVSFLELNVSFPLQVREAFSHYVLR